MEDQQADNANILKGTQLDKQLDRYIDVQTDRQIQAHEYTHR
jgi:hypothetical protein